MASAPKNGSRPLSPHLQVYRFSLLMAMSIIHRITGAALYFGTLLLVWWLVAAASGPQAYAVFSAVAGSFPGQLVLFGYTWALLHHMMGGIRHFIWDTGAGLGVVHARQIALLSIVASLGLTVLVWAAGLMAR